MSSNITRIERDGREYLRIDLREIPTFILHCEGDRLKRLMLQEQMSELGMNHEFVNSLRVDPGWVGVALGHTKVLRLPQARPPFLVLEDDCVFDEDFQPVIEVPAEADCLYLSASIFGLKKPGEISWGHAGGVFWERYAEGYLRVHNMLARHALLYLKPGFQNAAIEAGIEALANRNFPYMCDVGVAMLHTNHVALLTERSMCRQMNRESTGGCLAEILPDNELAGARIADVQPSESPRIVLPPTPRRKPLGTVLVSHRHQFIYFPIGKNAASTLTAEFRKPQYECEPFTLSDLDDETLNSYFKFTFLRDPVSRLVSAYQEISLRHELQDFSIHPRPFMKLDDDPERFEAFLAEVGKNKWDWRVLPQREWLGGVRMDFYGRVESFATGLQTVFDRLELGHCPELPMRKSRCGRKSEFAYDRFNIDHRQLPPELIALIHALYQDDVDLVEEVCPAPSLFTGDASLAQGAEARYAGTLQLRGGARHEFEVPADSAVYERLQGLVSGSGTTRRGGLFQVPLKEGGAALTFSGADVRFISLDRLPRAPRWSPPRP